MKVQVFSSTTSAQVVSCEYWEILKNNFSEEHLWTATSEGTFYVNKGSSYFLHIKLQTEWDKNVYLSFYILVFL